jgi:hypothetical protein
MTYRVYDEFEPVYIREIIREKLEKALKIYIT